MTSKGHIYMIFTPLDNSSCYIGSTFNRLPKRFQGHKQQFQNWLKDKDKSKKCSIFDYFEKYGIDNFKIILIKSYNVIRTHQKDHKHLNAYELLWINKTRNCVNELLPFNPLFKLDKNEYNKKYREENKEKINEKQKKIYQENKEKIKEQAKKKYENNKEQRKQKYTCVCGSTLTICKKLRHEKSKKHLNYCKKYNNAIMQ